MKKYWRIYKKHEEIINYLIVGVLTTVVSLIFYFASTRTFLDPNNAFQLQIANLIKWTSGVLFAYVTNKLWVFESKSKNATVVIKEILSFFGARIVSFVVFESLGFMLVRNILIITEIFESEDACKWIAKLLMAVIVVIFNYIMSKLVIFRKSKTEGEKS